MSQDAGRFWLFFGRVHSFGVVSLFEFFLLLFDQSFVPHFYFFPFLTADSHTFLLIFSFFRSLIYDLLVLFSFFPPKFFHLHFLSNVLFFLEFTLILLFLNFCLLVFESDFCLCLFLQHFYAFELLCGQFLLFFKLKITLVEFQVIHDLDIFHSKYFGTLFDDFLGISFVAVVDLYEVIMIPLKPFAFSSVYLHYLGIQMVYLFFQLIYSSLLTWKSLRLLLGHFFFVFFNLFNLIGVMQRCSNQILVNKGFDLELQRFFHFAEFVKSFYFFLLQTLNSLFKFQEGLHIDGAIQSLLFEIGHVDSDRSYFIESVLLEELEVKLSFVGEGIEVETFKFFGGFFD